MTTNFGIIALGTATVTDPLEFGWGGRVFLEPPRIGNPQKNGGGYSFEAKVLTQSFDFDFGNPPLQLTGMLPLGPLLNVGKEYAFVQFSTGASCLYSESNNLEEASQSFILRPLHLSYNWRADKQLAGLAGAEAGVEVPFDDFSIQSVKVFLGFHFGFAVH